MKKGFFISLEGGEGTGKSTQVRLLKEALIELGYSVVDTHDPSGTLIGSRIRGILLEKDYKELGPKVELLLFLAGRSQLVNEIIRPALNNDQIVISDRFHHSTFAYQGGARSLDMKLIREFNNFATEGLSPDITFLLDLPPEEGFERMQPKNNNGKEIVEKQIGLSLYLKNDKPDKPRINIDRIEREGFQFHEKVRQAFLKLASEDTDRIIVIDARKPKEEIALLIKNKALQLLRGA